MNQRINETRRQYLVRMIAEVLKFGASAEQIALMLESKGVDLENNHEG